jgi:hypothetical protein
MLSLFCSASMLPCGRYYYEPEGGYVGNPWVKFSYQYIYLYLAWFVHHLDLIDHYVFQFVQTFVRKYLKLYKKSIKVLKLNTENFFEVFNFKIIYTTNSKVIFLNSNLQKFNA